MPAGESDAFGAIEWLKVLIAVSLLSALVGAYFYIDHMAASVGQKLALSMIPGINVGLLAYIVIYFTMRRSGVERLSRQLIETNGRPLNEESFSVAVADRISAELSRHAALQDQEVLTSIRDVPWKLLIDESRESIVVAVYYCDTWISQQYESFLGFAGKPNTKMELHLANIIDDDILVQILSSFPTYSKEAFQAKVRLTKEGAYNVFSDVGASTDRVSVSYYPKLMHYSMILFDNSRLVVWFVDMNRKNTMNSPAFIFDLKKSEILRKYFMNEIDGIRAREIPFA